MSAPRAYDSRIEAARTHALENLERAITIAEVADVACLEPTYFSRLFRSVTGAFVECAEGCGVNPGAGICV